MSCELSSSDNASYEKTSVTRLACTKDQRRKVWFEMGGRPKRENLSGTVETWQSARLERGLCCSVSSRGFVHRQIQGRRDTPRRPSKVEDEFQVCVKLLCLIFKKYGERAGGKDIQNIQDDEAISW